MNAAGHGTFAIFGEPKAAGTVRAWPGVIAGIAGILCLLGAIGTIGGAIMTVTGSASERAASAMVLATGLSALLLGIFLFWLFFRLLARSLTHRSTLPRPVTGLVIDEGRMTWGTHSVVLRNGVAEQFRKIDVADVDASKSTFVIGIAATLRSIVEIGLVEGDQVRGNVIDANEPVFYVMHEGGIRLISNAGLLDRSLAARQCVESLRYIGEMIRQTNSGLSVRVVLAAERENWMWSGLCFGLLGVAVSTALDHHAKRRVERLVAEGGWRDSQGDIQGLADSFGWELLVV